MSTKQNDKIILGEGIFSIGNIDIAATRGGGVFEVVKEYRQIEHDGARGEVIKGMTRLDRATPKLTINALSILTDTDFSKMYANTKSVKSGEVTTITGEFDILDSDYQTVTWTGFTNDGKAIKITINNAINLENFNWALADKNEVVHALVYVGAYERGSIVQPWEIKFGTPIAKRQN